jgi:hypothetical protein
VSVLTIAGANIVGGNPKGARREADFYPSPWDVTQCLIDAELVDRSLPVWEPCCGSGDMAEVLRHQGFDVVATDLFDRGYGRAGVDVLAADTLLAPQIVTNPPFDISAAIIERLMSLRPAMLALVLKSQYWHAATRTALFQRYRPSHVLPMTWRPDFSGVGGSPTMDVIWTVWRPGSNVTEYLPLSRPLPRERLL